MASPCTFAAFIRDSILLSNAAKEILLLSSLIIVWPLVIKKEMQLKNSKNNFFIKGFKLLANTTVNFYPDQSFSYKAINFSLVIIFSQSFPSAFSQSGFMPRETLIMVSN